MSVCVVYVGYASAFQIKLLNRFFYPSVNIIKDGIVTGYKLYRVGGGVLYFTQLDGYFCTGALTYQFNQVPGVGSFYQRVDQVIGDG